MCELHALEIIKLTYRKTEDYAMENMNEFDGFVMPQARMLPVILLLEWLYVI